jgi:hypothetical protein
MIIGLTQQVPSLGDGRPCRRFGLSCRTAVTDALPRTSSNWNPSTRVAVIAAETNCSTISPMMAYRGSERDSPGLDGSNAAAVAITSHGRNTIHSRATSPMFLPDSHSTPHVNVSAKTHALSRRFGLLKTPISAVTPRGSPAANAASRGFTSSHFHHVRSKC